MSKYVLTYYGEPKFKSPEEGGKYMGRWQAWIASLGGTLVDPGVPFGKSKTVTSSSVSDDASPNRVTGFSIVKADSLDAAVKIAKGCPHLEHGPMGVHEAMDMTMSH